MHKHCCCGVNKDWSSKLNKYFATDWSHMLLSYKGKNNQIRVLSERYMRHNVTPINGKNESLAFEELMFGSFHLETTLECYPARLAPAPLDTQLGLLPIPIDANETCILHCNKSSSSSSNSASALEYSCTYELWNIYFDRSKAQDG